MDIAPGGISLTWTWQLRKLLAQHPTTVLQPTVGAVGYYLGSRRHVIDTLALGDPLLARLPAKPRWRVGHYERAVPEGYVESVATDSNRIVGSQGARAVRHDSSGHPRCPLHVGLVKRIGTSNLAMTNCGLTQ